MKLVLLATLVGLALPAAALEERHADSGTPHAEETDAHEEIEEAGVSSDVGPGKAVTAADPKRGIRLSEKAVQALGLKTLKVAKLPALLPNESLVASREITGVYRLRDGWYRFVHREELQPGDEIVIQGAGLLRVADIASFESGGGHHH